MTQKEIVIYTNRRYNPYIALARDILIRYNIPYREIEIQADETQQNHLQTWVDHRNLPIIIVTKPGQFDSYEPIEAPAALSSQPRTQPRRGVDQGAMIVQPNNQQLENWLYKHGFLDKPYKR